MTRRSLLATATAFAAPTSPAWHDLARLYPVDRSLRNFNHAGVDVVARIASFSGNPSAISFDISAGKSINDPFMLPACKSGEIVSG